MAEIRNIQRGDHSVVPGAWPGGTGGSLVVGQLTPSNPVNGTILRSLSFPSVHVSVGAPGAGTPPEDWWMQASFSWFIWATFSSFATVPTFGYDNTALFCGKLYPTLVASPSAPTEYYVTFEGPEQGFESKGQRHAIGGASIYMNTGLRWDDPLGGLDTATYSNVSVYTRSTDICIFGEQP